MKVDFDFNQTILDQLNALIFIIDFQEQNIIWANKYFYSIMRYSKEELNTLFSKELISLFQPVYNNLCTGKSDNLEEVWKTTTSSVILKVKSKNKSCIWLLTNNSIFESIANPGQLYLLTVATEIIPAQIKMQINQLAYDATIEMHNNTSVSISATEKKVLSLISNGKTDREISEFLSISIHTAKTHRKKIIHKFGLRNSAELIAFVIRNNIV